MSRMSQYRRVHYYLHYRTEVKKEGFRRQQKSWCGKSLISLKDADFNCASQKTCEHFKLY